ncbi:MAG: hypothetical protein QME50_02045 [Candidatus Bathyarchaeota archaeon]|nr:hypothetical protein [Candidatus Bathyarchaeota archaeon]MDI6805669.1 hypothetical protein [Candidatus Bathyarchaeia archaeon]
MPFTPFHLGPALLFGLALSAIFDFPTILVASVIPDLEPFCVVYFHVYNYPLHGFFHSYLGTSVLAVFVAIIIYPLRGWLDRVLTVFGISQKSSFRKIMFTSFFGVYLHVFLDSFLYGEMNPFYPLLGNPFIHILLPYGSYSIIYGFCSLTAVLGIILYLYKTVKVRLKEKEKK